MLIKKLTAVSTLVCLFMCIMTVPCLAAKPEGAGERVNVINKLGDKKISRGKIDEVIDLAEKALEEEIHLARKYEPFTFDYVLLDDEVSYFYEKSLDKKPELVIYPTSSGKKSNYGTRAYTDLPKGIGGRVKMKQNGNILTTTIKTSTTSQVEPKVGTAYLYTGFESNKGSTDIGLMYHKDKNIWHPYFRYSNDPYGYRFVKGYNQVCKENGFIPGEDINIAVYKNYGGRIRYKSEGYARHSNKKGEGGPTWLVHVIESTKEPNIGTVDCWKILATIAVSSKSQEAQGKVYGKFKDIRIDGSKPSFSEPEEDHADVRIRGNDVTIKVKR